MPDLFKHTSELWSWIAENIEQDEDYEELILPESSEEFILKLSNSNIELIYKSLEFCLIHKVILIDKEVIINLKKRENIEFIIRNNIEDIIKSITIIKNDPNIKDLAGVDNSIHSLILFIEKLMDYKKFNSVIEYIG